MIILRTLSMFLVSAIVFWAMQSALWAQTIVERPDLEGVLT
jgi:hypothetical protein